MPEMVRKLRSLRRAMLRKISIILGQLSSADAF